MKNFGLVGAIGVSVLLLLGTGCGDGDDDGGDGGGGGTGGSCTDYNGAVECLDYTGAGWDLSTAQMHCQGMQGTHSTGACPIAGRLARCTISQGEDLEYWHVYYDATRLAEAESACAGNNGVWETL